MSLVVDSNSFENLSSFISQTQNSDAKNSFKSMYNSVAEIGRGRFAKVSLVSEKSSPNQLYASKIIRRFRTGQDTIENILREIYVLKISSKVEQIVKLHDFYMSNSEIAIILEYCQGGDLFHFCMNNENSLSELNVINIIRQLLLAVRHLHDNSFVHLDIKPENILLRSVNDQNYKIALCDFGLAKYLDKNIVVRDMVGTPDYAAPEILNFDRIHFQTDCWSIGVVTYYLLTNGESPFCGETKDRTLYNVTTLNITYPSDLFANISQKAINFVKANIQKNPTLRPTVVELLSNTWLSNNSHDEDQGDGKHP